MAEPTTAPPKRALAPEIVLLALFVLLAIVAVAVTPELRDAILGSAPRAQSDAGAGAGLEGPAEPPPTPPPP